MGVNLVRREELQPLEVNEYEERIERARRLMHEQSLDALVLSAEQNLLYFTGFRTQFFASPSRPWFFVLPLQGEPCAIVPALGEGPLRETTWVRNVRTWISPNAQDEGVSIVVDFLRSCPRVFGRIGFELGPESRMGFPVEDFLRMRQLLGATEAVDGERLVRRLRYVKSPQEIARLRRVCRTVSDAFDALPDGFCAGDTERNIANRFRDFAFRATVDRVPYLTFDVGQGGYRTAISEPGDRVLRAGDVFTIDAGCVVEGYHSDFNRNWAIARASDEARRAYEVLYRATAAALAVARPGVRTSDLFAVQMKVITDALPRFKAPAQEPNFAGRFGHGLGLHLTEPPSNSPDDHTVLVPGAVLTIEPCIAFSATQIMLTEEDVVITEDGCELLSRRAPSELPIIPL